MKWTNSSLFAGAAVATLSVAAIAGQSAPQAKTVRGGESGLVGVKLYDSGTRVISLYGNPTEIQAVGFGGQGIGPAGGGPGPVGGGRPAGGGAPGAGVGRPGPEGVGGGGGGGKFGGADFSNSPSEFGFGNDVLLQGPLGAPAAAGPPPGVQVPGAGMGGPPGAGGGRPGMGGGGMAPAGGGGDGAKVLYTRWIYRRGPSKYGFILDKFNRVVQVEAIGMNDGRVRTSKGIKFGSTFGDVMKKYQTPDGYEISGDNIVMRYLVRNKVAFRLSRLGEKRPHVVTGIVVAGGKT